MGRAYDVVWAGALGGLSTAPTNRILVLKQLSRRTAYHPTLSSTIVRPSCGFPPSCCEHQDHALTDTPSRVKAVDSTAIISHPVLIFGELLDQVPDNTPLPISVM